MDEKKECCEEHIPGAVLVDEDGTEHKFVIVGETELDGKKYVALSPFFHQEGEECDHEGLILRDEGDSLATIDDEDEFKRVAEAFGIDGEFLIFDKE